MPTSPSGDEEGSFTMLTIQRFLFVVLLLVVVVFGPLGLVSHAHADEPAGCAAAFENEPEVESDSGDVSLKWGSPCESAVFEVQDATEPSFAEPEHLYRGGDQTTYLSGLPDGEYYFRVRARSVDSDIWGDWSEPVKLTCTHHPLWLAWTLFSSGGFLFLALVVFVCVNARHLDRFERNHA